MAQKLTVITRKNVEARMNRLLQRLGLSFTVQWVPDPTKNNHGSVNMCEGIINIHDSTEPEAWVTLEHEVLELKMRPAFFLYRGIVNSLIDLIEKATYREKEKFLESLPTILKEFQKERGEANAEKEG